jgi:DNA-binding NtrC family response regulator
MLVVDDDAEFLSLLARDLAALGFLVERAGSLAQARTLMDAVAFDAALVDLNLAHESGLDLLQRLRDAAGSTEIVIMSGEASVASAVEAMRRGAFDFVEKPFDLARVELILQRAVERARLVRENQALRAHLGAGIGRLGPAVPTSDLGPLMRRLYDDIERLAALEVPVLVTGESGVGKEFVARALHERSRRATRPWMPVNCGGLNPELLDSELFGHEKGAFTGARDRKPGLVEVAEGGTLFLDEIGELSAEAQVKLLRFIELGEFRRVGGSDVLRANVRIVAATNRDLGAAMAAGRFREDLYYRLSAVTTVVPPLRQRREEIHVFVEHFLILRGEHRRFSRDVIAALTKREWRGNLRELRNAVDKLLLAGDPSRVTPADVDTMLPPSQMAPTPAASAQPALPAASESNDGDDLSLASMERRQIVRALERFRWNQTRAARALGINPRTLYRRIRELGLKPPSEDR